MAGQLKLGGWHWLETCWRRKENDSAGDSVERSRRGHESLTQWNRVIGMPIAALPSLPLFLSIVPNKFPIEQRHSS
jgi:hypothetical protein